MVLTPGGRRSLDRIFAVANPLVDDNAWTFSGNTTKNVYDIVLPNATPAGSRVWITAFWFNNRMDSGPAATAVSVNVPRLGLMAA